jgi:uncharacterized protein YeaO (DUF488 family)
VYDAPAPGDGQRVLVDRLWPRGVSKESLSLVQWARDAAPSAELRRHFCHDPVRWEEFEARYWAKLDANPQAWQPIVELARQGTVTLLFAARETTLNNATALRDYLGRKLAGRAAEPAARRRRRAPVGARGRSE